MNARPAGRLGAVLLGILLVVGLLVSSPGRGAAAPDPDPVGDLVDAVTLATPADAADVRAYWTPQRMEAAIPLGLDPAGEHTTGQASTTRPRAAARTAARSTPTPRSVGKLFFSVDGGDAVCSASAVNTPGRDVIITAGHCAHDGGPTCGLLGCTPGKYYSNFLFVPRYANGAGPDGSWVGSRAITHQQWIDSGDSTYDQALIEVLPNRGRRLVDVVGGNGIAWNYPVRESGIAIWGWPAEAPYDGETVRSCYGSTDSFEGSADAGMSCPLTGGASGGPWFIAMVNRNVGFIWAVTSRRTLIGAPALLAHPITDAIRGLVAVADARAVVAPRGIEPRPVARAARVVLRAQRRHVGAGQLIQLTVHTRAHAKVVLEVRWKRHGRWHRVAAKHANRHRVAVFSSRAKRPGLRWYRARALHRATGSLRLRVLPCPIPLHGGSGGAALGCSAPTG
ncbi:MAG TPA: hypothetical protein VNS81_04475 [Nocardioides sp.]|nr:hypothetical protein [Nocardioides sp.]